VLIAGLIFGGFLALSGLDKEGNPLLGGMAVLAGIALIVVAFLYLRRPVRRGRTPR
jgi:hypothetical protein